MNSQEIQELKLTILGTAAYYGQTIPDHVLAMFVEDLVDLSLAEVAAAIKEIRRDPKTIRFPLPAIIRDRISPAITPENDALEAVSRIIAAVSRVGPYRVSDAREFVGELGWAVVQREGSWENVCKILTDENIGVLRAQWKQIALSQISRAKAGVTSAPRLPSSGGELKRLGFGDAT
jgi:hypothetical protein